MVILLWVTLAAEILTVVVLAIGIACPRRSLWPPPRPHSWQHTFVWLLFVVSAGGVIALGIVDWGSLPIAPWLRSVVALPLWGAGNGLALWAMVVLGVASTYGREGLLVRRGPYGLSRNPQYAGFMVALIGWALMASSAWTLAASLTGLIPLILVPFVEEPWLMAKHGLAYEEYKCAVPRFVSLRRRSNGV